MHLVLDSDWETFWTRRSRRFKNTVGNVVNRIERRGAVTIEEMNTCRYHIICRYFEQRVHVYDMGPGDSEYKQRWATAAREHETFWLFKRTPYALALYNMERRAVPPLRRAREWWRKSGDQPDTRVDV
jgi:hypothetical protein